MPQNTEQSLSRREREILDIVYAQGRASALQVVGLLAKAPTKTAVRTHLRILEEKGHLSHIQEGQTYYYQPTRPREKEGKSALRRVLNTFFESSLEQAVAAHLGQGGQPVSDEELNRIAQLIETAKQKKN
jgi:BlaI family penicillinase repressor